MSVVDETLPVDSFTRSAQNSPRPSPGPTEFVGVPVSEPKPSVKNEKPPNAAISDSPRAAIHTSSQILNSLNTAKTFQASTTSILRFQISHPVGADQPSITQTGITTQSVLNDSNGSLVLSWLHIGLIIAGVSLFAVVISVVIIQRKRRKNLTGQAKPALAASKSSFGNSDSKWNDWDHSKSFYTPPQTSAYTIKSTKDSRSFTYDVNYASRAHPTPIPLNKISSPATYPKKIITQGDNRFQSQNSPQTKHPSSYSIQSESLASPHSFYESTSSPASIELHNPTFEKLGSKKFQLSPLVFSPLTNTALRSFTPEQSLDTSFTSNENPNTTFESANSTETRDSSANTSSTNTYVEDSDDSKLQHIDQSSGGPQNIGAPKKYTKSEKNVNPTILIDAKNSDALIVGSLRKSVHQEVFGRSFNLSDLDMEDFAYEVEEVEEDNEPVRRYSKRTTLRPSSLSTIGELSETSTSLARTNRSDATM
ncbi:hypothetical protein HK098_006762 [Nowakowskiella sp. JEL0407]|nr:hypothetical protein HK098_006762 [Nowakowskiella sp. JEL0407]